MKTDEIGIAVERIMCMEILFDELQAVWETSPELFFEEGEISKKLEALTEYFEGGVWLSDYTLDSEGKLPDNLKRGVLSEDGVYNFLGEIGEYNDATVF